MNDFEMEEEQSKDLVLYTGQRSIMNWTTQSGLQKMQDLARMFATSELVPKQYQGKPANCLIALDIAMRFEMAPFEVFQNMNPIYGKPTFSVKWQIAKLQQSGLIKGQIRYEFGGAKRSERWCVAHCETVEGEKIRGPKISYALAEAEGWTNRPDRNGYNTSKWPTMTDLMLSYRAASWMISQYFPQVTMGVPDTESTIDAGPRDITQEGSHVNIMEGAPRPDAGAVPPLKTKHSEQPQDEQPQTADQSPTAEPAAPEPAPEPEPIEATATQETDEAPARPKNWGNPHLDSNDTKFSRAEHATKGGVPRKDEHGRFVPIRKRRKSATEHPKTLEQVAQEDQARAREVGQEFPPAEEQAKANPDEAISLPDQSAAPSGETADAGEPEDWETELENLDFE